MDFLSIGLPKWPMMATIGKRVTEDQAAEIIVRCSSLHFSCNDKRWDAELYGALGLVVGKHGWVDDWQSVMDKRRELRSVETGEYLDLDSRLSTAYIGGPHGWMNWDGRVGEAGHNIGKWPTVEDVREGWANIAAAFPYLELRCQLFSGEGCEDDIRPVIEYRVADGSVEMREPGETMTHYPRDIGTEVRRMMSYGGERGCTIEDFKRGIELARGVIV